MVSVCPLRVVSVGDTTPAGTGSRGGAPRFASLNEEVDLGRFLRETHGLEDRVYPALPMGWVETVEGDGHFKEELVNEQVDIGLEGP